MNRVRSFVLPSVVGAIVVFTAICCPASPYYPDCTPTCDISTQTVETIPAPRNRTEIGICEQVTCSITNWQATAGTISAEAQGSVTDPIGMVTWSAGYGTVVPNQGSTTTYTAPDGDLSDTVTASVPDSLGVYSPLSKSVTFQVDVPTGSKPFFDHDIALGNPGPPNNQIGAKSYFYAQILPNSVNFSRCSSEKTFQIRPSTRGLIGQPTPIRPPSGRTQCLILQSAALPFQT